MLTEAICAGLLMSIACGIMGTYVVLKRMSYLAESISHAAFGGIGISLYFNFPPLLGAGAVGLISAIIMGFVRFSNAERDDTLIGAIWALGMAIGILFSYLTPGYIPDLFTYLFGNILLMSTSDFLLISGLNIAILLCVWRYFHAFQLITCDELYATVINLPVRRLTIALLSLLSITVIILIQAVGIILVITLLTLPAASAEKWSQKLSAVMGIAILFGMISTTFGILLSYILNLPSGPLIIFTCFFIFIISIFWEKTSHRFKRT